MRLLLAILASTTLLCAKTQAQTAAAASSSHPPGAPANPSVAPAQRPVASTHLPIAPLGIGVMPWQPLSLYNGPDLGNLSRKWQLRPYTGLSAGYLFFNGGGISYLSAPIGLNLYHPLTTNLTAFAGVSLNPTLFNVGSLSNPLLNPAYPGSNFSSGYGFGINPAIQGGLIYTNDAHTFSISGSVFMERGSSPVYPSRRTDAPKQ